MDDDDEFGDFGGFEVIYFYFFCGIYEIYS